MLPPSGDIRDQSLKWYKIDRNFACFGPNVLVNASPPNFWTCITKVTHFPMTKFHGDRPRELEDFVAKVKETSPVKHKAVHNYNRPNSWVDSKAVAQSL